ncbi:hypothetical protein EPN29_13140 [bacterium]|nr:MAG: hypothetical protein EPN29_13140 [bacterium]
MEDRPRGWRSVTLATSLPAGTSLVLAADRDRRLLALWRGGRLFDLSPLTLDELLTGSAADMRAQIESGRRWPEIVVGDISLLSPVEGQEVWGAGVTYLRSRQARMEESTDADVYERVYQADRPELFFKASGWRVIPPGGEVGIRPDSTWDVPEPELAVLTNSRGEAVAYSCGNDMSSRSIEGDNPLYLPQAKIYDRSCSIGPAAVLAWELGELPARRIQMTIERDGSEVFAGVAPLSDMVRDPVELCGVLHAAYRLPVGAWLLTGTPIVPPPPYSAAAGDVITISVDGLGALVNRVTVVTHSGATAIHRPGRLQSQV